MSKYIEVKVTTWAQIEETWRVRVLDDAQLPTTDVLDLLPNGNCVYERTLGGESDREVIDVGWAEPYDHAARPDDLAEPGDRCKDCGENITWIGPSVFDWIHLGEADDA